MSQTVTLTNETGMHARPAGIFVKAASQFQSDIKIEAAGQVANGKSIMNLLGLGLEKGMNFTIQVDGADEDEALSTLVTLIQKQFEA
ncbi:MAG: phosphocarrier protein HPr [Bdellovibrionales bacterium CG10_big_fil_rev_8_21_14_0_10_45_34]|nr:MAG: phosphocarrier protein HPr [Bdellovibrionales bacterium CG10_big_fil_rev_8_21_14_0_10_45_34]